MSINICELQLIEEEKIIISSLIDNYKIKTENKQYYAKELEERIHELLIQHKINNDILNLYDNSDDYCIEVDIEKIYPKSNFRNYIEKLCYIANNKDIHDRDALIFDEKFYSKKMIFDHIRDLKIEIYPLEEILIKEFIKYQEILTIIKEHEDKLHNIIFSIT